MRLLACGFPRLLQSGIFYSWRGPSKIARHMIYLPTYRLEDFGLLVLPSNSLDFTDTHEIAPLLLASLGKIPHVYLKLLDCKHVVHSRAWRAIAGELQTFSVGPAWTSRSVSGWLKASASGPCPQKVSGG